MIFVDCRLVSKQETGISRFSIEIANRLYLTGNNEEIFFIVNAYNDTLPGTQVLCPFKPFNLYHFFRFQSWLSKRKPRVYISLHYSGLYKKIKGCKTFVTVHDLMFLFVANFFNGKARDFVGKVYFKFVVGLSIRSCSKVLSVSHTTASDVKRIFNRDSIVTGEGVGLSNYASQLIFSERIRKKVGETGYFFYVGNCRPHKCLKEFINGFDLYKKNGGKLNFVIAGGKPENKVDGTISLGYVSDEELTSLYQNATAFIFPSRYEGFGLPILEALSSGLTIKANDIPAFREFNSKNIDFFDVDSKVSIAKSLNSVTKFDHDDADITLSRYTWDIATKIIIDKTGVFDVK